MAPDDLKSKKRKGAAESAPKPKKQKKSDDAAAAVKKSAKALKGAVESVDNSSGKPTRTQAEDFFSDEDAPRPATTKEKKPKKSKAAAKVNTANDEAEEKSDVLKAKDASRKKVKKDKTEGVEAAPPSDAPKEKGKKSKKAKGTGEFEAAPITKLTETTVLADEAPLTTVGEKSKKMKTSKSRKDEPKVEVIQAVVDTEDTEDENVEDDQTAALLAGFESDRDESDLGQEDEDFDEDINPKITKQLRLELQKAEKSAKKDEPGVIFVGRVPHGFFEPQMKRYFQQFGTVTRLRLSRNKKTGASKHFAFVEFASPEVADIVAKTMNNYLMFGHILQCKVVPSEQIHPDLFKGAGERFKVDPRNKKVGLEMQRGVDRAVWEKRIDKENKRRAKNSKKLKEAFDYEFTAPSAKGLEEVPKKVSVLQDGAAQQLLTEARAEEVAAIEQTSESRPGQLTVTETVTIKKGRKGAKAKAQVEPEETELIEKAEIVQEKKGKKDKKRKSDVVTEINGKEEKVVGDEVITKSKKAKKAATSDGAIEEVIEENMQTKRKIDQQGAKPKKAKKSKA